MGDVHSRPPASFSIHNSANIISSRQRLYYSKKSASSLPMPSNLVYHTPRGVRLLRIARQHNGRTSHSRSFYYISSVQGQRCYFSLGREFRQAANLAEQISAFLFAGGQIQEAARRFTPEKAVRQARQQISTLGEVLECYLDNHVALDVRESTARDYCVRLVSVIAEVLQHRTGAKRQMTREEIGRLPVSILTRKLLVEFKNIRAGAITDERKLLSAKRTINSRLRDSKALFKPSALDIYRDNGLVLPNLDEFLGTPIFTRTKICYQLPDPMLMQTLIAAGHDELPALGANEYLIFVLALHAGLRAKEILFSRWSWLGQSDRPYLRIAVESDLRTKNSRGRTIELEPWVFELLTSYRDDLRVHILKSEALLPRKEAAKRVFVWLRSKGLDTLDKPLHELRKWYGSFVAQTVGLTEAQRRLGHTTPQVTFDYYADLEFPDWLADSWRKPPPKLTGSTGAQLAR